MNLQAGSLCGKTQTGCQRFNAVAKRFAVHFLNMAARIAQEENDVRGGAALTTTTDGMGARHVGVRALQLVNKALLGKRLECSVHLRRGTKALGAQLVQQIISRHGTARTGEGVEDKAVVAAKRSSRGVFWGHERESVYQWLDLLYYNVLNELRGLGKVFLVG